MNNPFFREIEDAKTILLIGAGGGFDVFTGLPLYRWLRDRGKTVQLANVSSGALAFCDAKTPTPGVWHITPETKANAYFPEIYLARWLADQGGETPVYAIEPAGARTIASAFSWLADQTQPDAIVLVDGGTDSLMRGDEAGLGTPEADMVSLYAANLLHQVLRKFVVCLGFGIDTHHGVCHAHFLENVAALIGDDAYLGTWSLTRDMPEFLFYREACEYVFARLPRQPSIVNTSIIAAVNGSFGDHHSTKRTQGSTLFINPLMGLYWSFRLEHVARRSFLLEHIRDTTTLEEVSIAIERFRDGPQKIRPWRQIPC